MAVGVARLQTFFGISCTMNVLLFIIPPIRFWVLRARTRNTFALCSDLVFAFASIIVIISGSFSIQAYVHELKVRQTAESELEVIILVTTEAFLKIEFARAVLYVVMLWCTKAAFLLLYWSLYAPVSVHRMQVLWFTAFLLPASFAVALILYFTDCIPMSYMWDIQRIVERQQVCSPAFGWRTQLITTILNIITDLLLVLLPLLMLHSLKLSKIERRVIPFIFLLGIVSISATLVRFIILENQGAYEVSNGPKSTSMTELHWVDMLSTLEIFAAFTAFCMPAFRFLIKESITEVRSRVRSAHLSRSTVGAAIGDKHTSLSAQRSSKHTASSARHSGGGATVKGMGPLTGPLTNNESNEVILPPEIGPEDMELEARMYYYQIQHEPTL